MSGFRLTKITSLKDAEAFKNHTRSIGADIPIDDQLLSVENSPFLESREWNGRSIGNRIAVQPMEGWDGTTTGGVTQPMIRRWERFGESGGKLIWGGEAMAVTPSGRANPNQLILSPENVGEIADLRARLVASHEAKYAKSDDLVIGFQLTHSGRFCRPDDKKTWKPRVAYRHPLLDPKFGVTSDSCVLSDAEIDELIGMYVKSARLAEEAGADFVDIKACHGYLLHEFLGAYTRSGPYGGSFENRTRLLLTIIKEIQSAAPKLGIGVRLSAFDSVPYQRRAGAGITGAGLTGVETSGGQDQGEGTGEPTPHSHLLPYVYGFGMSQENPVEMDLRETILLVGQLESLGVRLVNLTAGSPYYTPHLVRPASYPPSDGYQLFEDPLLGVANHLRVVATLKKAHPETLFVGSGYSYLQEFLPNVAQRQLLDGNVDFVGLGRMTLSYPRQILDAVVDGKSERKLVCRTFSDCTTAPRNGLPSGCYPLDPFYKSNEDAKRLKEIKAQMD